MKVDEANQPTELDRILAELRHLYTQLVGGHVKDTARAANGLLAPQIRRLEAMQERRRASRQARLR